MQTIRKQRWMPLMAVLVGAALGLSAASTNASTLITSGLIQDLDADAGVTLSGSQVTGWANQAGSGGDDVSSTGGAGTVTVVAGPNGGDALRFTNSQRLVGDDVSAFDSLVNGGGFTWLAVVDANNNAPSKNQIFGTLTNSNPFSGMTAGVGSNLPYT